jgi:homoserine kinase
VVAGLVRDDVPGTLGVVLAVGLGVSAVAIVAAVAVRERRT